jgi:hypothetical protein
MYHSGWVVPGRVRQTGPLPDFHTGAPENGISTQFVVVKTALRREAGRPPAPAASGVRIAVASRRSANPASCRDASPTASRSRRQSDVSQSIGADTPSEIRVDPALISRSCPHQPCDVPDSRTFRCFRQSLHGKTNTRARRRTAGQMGKERRRARGARMQRRKACGRA